MLTSETSTQILGFEQCRRPRPRFRRLGQLASQRENQARQAALDEQRIALQSVQNERELESLAFNRQRQATSDRLDAQKFQLLQEEKNQKMQEIEKKNREEAESGRLFSIYKDAKFSDDPDKMAMAEGELNNSTLSA
jgi:flagellar motility protein MotE (MotC chaperone)